MLLGSGTSTAAQVPTGWGVVIDLIGKVAALQGEDAAREAADDPEGWWARQGYGGLRYNTLLGALAPSVAARRDLLQAYFEPTDDDERDRGVKRPTAAHHAIAKLVTDGRIRLILTTNFDHLIEDALATAGVPPQVITRPEAIRGMAPLQHARATVIKLHGDYLDVEAIRNTPAELASYDPAIRDLLAQVFDEYGLIILGWSGEWDTALVHAIESCPSRRYPAYWAAYKGQVSRAGKRLIASRGGHLLPIADADTFCTGLLDNVSTLARMADPPPTRAVATGTLKRNLRPDRRIEAFDQVNAATMHTISRFTDHRYPVSSIADADVPAELERQLAAYDTDTDILTALAATAIFHGGPDTDGLILRAARLLAERPRVTGHYMYPLANVRRYPALRIVTAAGVAAVAANRDALLISLLLRTTSATLENSHEEIPLVRCLYPQRVFAPEAFRMMPRYQVSPPRWRESHYLRTSCRAAFAEFTDDREYSMAFDRYELLRGMLEIHYDPGKRAALGELADRMGTSSIIDTDQINDQWPLVAAGAFDGDTQQARLTHATLLQQITDSLFLPFRS